MRRTPASYCSWLTFEWGASRNRRGQRLQHPQRRRRSGQTLQHRVDARAGVVVRAPRIALTIHVDVDRRHHLHGPAQVVEDDHRVGQREADLRHAQIVGLGAGDALERRGWRRS